MSLTVTKPTPLHDDSLLREMPLEDRRARQADQLRLLWDRRRLLVRATAVGLLASALLAFLIPKSYTSTAQLMPPDPQSSSGLAMMATLAAKGAGGLGSMAADLLGMNSTGALFVGILRSDAAQSRLVEQFDLRKVYGVRLEQDAREHLDQSTIISEDRKSGIISISVTDRSPDRAAALTRAYIDQLNSLIAELSTSAAHRERVFLEERLKIAKHDLDDASNVLAQYSSQNGTVDIQTMGKAALEAAGTLAGELIVAQSELEGLRQIYSDTNPRVLSLNARVGELRRELEKLGGTKDMPMRADSSSDSAATTTSPDPRSIDMPYPSLRNLPLLGVRYADYYRRAKIQETVYELLTQQYELAKIQEAKETPSVKVLDRPKVAEKRSSPPRLLITVLGGFLVFCGAIAWVIGSVSWHTSDPHDPRKILAREVVSTLKAKVLSISRNGHGRGAESNSNTSHD
jgi:capsule polysaccharide export protein KpsE/RkpR